MDIIAVDYGDFEVSLGCNSLLGIWMWSFVFSSYSAIGSSAFPLFSNKTDI